MSVTEDLLDYIFDGGRSALYADVERWLRESRRYRTFVGDYRDKIRAKLRNVRDEAGLSDVRAELETAARLLREDRFTLEYEKFAAAKQRSPDFTVTYRTHTPFNIEVRRIRGVEQEAEESDARIIKLMAVLTDKVGQMPPNSMNLLWLIAERAISEAELVAAAANLRQLAERKDEDYFTRRGFDSAADYLRRYRNLSGVILFASDAHTLWLNPVARRKVPPEIGLAIRRLESADL